MALHRQKVNLSFSIENILRDDFSHPRKANVVSLPSREARFECWPNTPIYRCYAVPYNPVFMKYLPTAHRAGVRLHRVNGDSDHFLAEQTTNIEDDCLSCKDEEIKKDNGKSFSIS